MKEVKLSRASLPVLSRMCGVGVTLLGAVVLAGWITHQPALLLQPRPDSVAMVSGTALCFVLAGMCLLLGQREDERVRVVVRSAALLLISIPLLGFIAGTTSYPNALDLTGFHSWLGDGNPYPGRMAPNTRAAFLFAGIALLLLSRQRVSRADWAIPVAVLAVLLLAVSGLIGFLLANDLILPWQRARMALPTAIGMLAVGLGSWQAWRLRVAHAPMIPVSRIVGSSALILSAAVLAAGLSGFATLAGQTRSAISASLEQTLQTRKSLLAEAIDRTAKSAHFLASNSLLIEQLEKSSDPAGDATPAQNLELGKTLAASEFRAIRVVDPRGRLLASGGIFVESTEKPVALDRNGRTALIWNDAFFLRTSTPIVGSSQRPVGTLIAESELGAFTAEWKNLKRFGKTAESVLCVLSSATTSRCFPHARNRVFSTAPISVNGKTVPMGLALQGRTGTGAAVDYRGKEVIASFAPLPGTPLGLVIKQDSAEIFAPIRKRLRFMLPMLGAIIGVGLWLLRSQVRPLAVNLAHSERAAHAARDLLAQAHDEIAVIVGGITDCLLTSDESGRIVSANAAATTMFGYGEGEMVGMDLKMLMPPDFRAAHEAGMRRFLRDGTTRVIGQGAVELTGLRRDESRFPLELSLGAVQRADDHLIVGVIRDISTRKQNETAIKFERERLRVTLHSIADAVITTDTLGVISSMNPMAEQLTGWSNDEATGKPVGAVFTIFLGDSDEASPSPVDMVLSTGAIGGLAPDSTLLRRDGTRVAVDDSASPIRDADSEIVGVVLVFRDVTASREHAGKVTHQASHDALTDLINRREFEQQVAAVLNGEGPQSRGHVLLFMDLDQFKTVNDTAGHRAGDELLKAVAILLSAQLRPSDELARLGGDEFTVVLRDCPLDAGLRIAESLRNAVADFRFTWHQRSFVIGVSIGVVHFYSGSSFSELMSQADSACYIAKKHGRNRVHVNTGGPDLPVFLGEEAS